MVEVGAKEQSQSSESKVFTAGPEMSDATAVVIVHSL